jgi:hypothetical protein
MRAIEQKHIDTIKGMADVEWAWRVGDIQYRVERVTVAGSVKSMLVLYWFPINSGQALKGIYIELGDELDDDLWNALRIGWYELYTPIEIKDAQRKKHKL